MTGRTLRSRARQTLRRLALAAAFAAVVIGVIVVTRTSSPAGYILRIPTEDASGITSGSDVTIAGVTAGTVRGVTLTPGGQALITVALDQAFAPVHANCSVEIRPKSLLGEMYVDITPGTSGAVLASGATLRALQVNRSTDLQQVLNVFNQPTRTKLQTLIDALGGGLSGRAVQVNDAIPSGEQDLSDLASITSMLNARNQELESVIATLNTITIELASSNRRQQLGTFISSAQQLMSNLQAEQARLQQAVVTADGALTDLQQGLQGTAGALSGVAASLPQTVQGGNALLLPLGTDANSLLPELDNLLEGIQWGPSVFGGNDASGYATRISLTLGCGTVTVCPQLSLPAGGTGAASSVTGSSTGPAAGDSASQGILGFLLGGLS